MKKLLLSLIFLSLTGLGYAQKIRRSDIPSMVSEERKKGNIKIADSIAEDYIDHCLLKLKKEALLIKDNLLFISENLKYADSKGFDFFYKNRMEVNAVLGADKAEYALRYAIARQYIPKMTEGNSVILDWEELARSAKGRFGSIGEESIYGRAMLHYLQIKDWNTAGKYYMYYFKTALTRPEYDINEITWPLFENVADQVILKFACDTVMKYAMEEWYPMEFNAYDTYANLLYKTGRKQLAIEWEERAVKLSNRSEVFVQTLEKMRKGEKTWVK